MWGKKKKTAQELEIERNERIEKSCHNLQVQAAHAKKLKEKYAQEYAKAKANRCVQEENLAKEAWKKAATTEKRINGMLIRTEIARCNKELASISADFMQCIADISEDIIVSDKKTNVKKTKNLLLKGAYRQKQQAEKIDEMLDACDTTSFSASAEGIDPIVDAELDAQLEAEASVYLTGRGSLQDNRSRGANKI